MWVSHQITAFQVLGKEKALTVFPPTLVWFYLVNRISCPWVIFSDVGRIMRSHSSLPVYIIARIALGVSRLLATLCDNFWGSVCAGQGMLSRPSLTVYMIARIDLGIMRHRATLCDNFQGSIRAGQETTGYLAGVTNILYRTDCLAPSEKPLSGQKARRQRIDQNHHP